MNPVTCTHSRESPDGGRSLLSGQAESSYVRRVRWAHIRIT